jgi:hypothetical protein
MRPRPGSGRGYLPRKRTFFPLPSYLIPPFPLEQHAASLRTKPLANRCPSFYIGLRRQGCL